MDWLQHMGDTIDYIENHLKEDILYDEVAKRACCSLHQFGRVFSYIVGLSLSEYIRMRRLTQAALDLQRGHKRVIDVALDYGYQSPDAFTRAFTRMHGVTPKEARTLDVRLKAYPRITFHLTIKGDEEMEYRIVDKPDIHMVGVVTTLERQTANKDANNWREATGEEWTIWKTYLDGINVKIRDEYRLYRPPIWQVGFTETLADGRTLLAIGAEADPSVDTPDLAPHVIPASKWAVFSAKGKLTGRDHPMGALWTRITTEWFPTSGYERAADYELQVYPPGDTSQDDYVCEIWVPIQPL